MAKRINHKPLKPFGNTTNPDSLYHHCLRFLQYSQVIHLSATTIQSRETYLRCFIIWCDERDLICPQEITRPIIERYQRHLFLRRKPNGNTLSVTSQYNYLAAIKAFFAWLTRSNYILYNPAGDLDMPKIPKRLPRHILSASDAETILNQADTHSALGLRDRAIMEVLYSTGMRRMELTSLKTNDLDTERGTLIIRQGKGKKDRMIPVGERAISWVKKYLHEVRPELVIGLSADILFLSKDGDELSVDRLTRLVGKYITDANIGKSGSCHLFRHTMATLMLENGADIRYIQVMLGHTKLETTQIYTQVNISKLKEIHTATHPAKAYKTSGPNEDKS